MRFVITLISLLLFATPLFADSEILVPADTTRTFLMAQTGGDAGAATLTIIDQYELMPLSLTEVLDYTSSFTVNADEICYTGASTIQVYVEVSLSMEQTAGPVANAVSIAFGEDTTGEIGNGDQFGEIYKRTIGGNDAIGMGAIDSTVELATNDCIGILLASGNVTPNITMFMRAATVTITVP